MIFGIYFIENIKPKRTKFEFTNISKEADFINNYDIVNKNGRIAIYLDINSAIFKEYNYHSYISGDGIGRKINMKAYLISEDEFICYKIKCNCYDYSNMENLKFMGYYYENFIKSDKKYKLAIYVEDTNIMYVTDIIL